MPGTVGDFEIGCGKAASWCILIVVVVDVLSGNVLRPSEKEFAIHGRVKLVRARSRWLRVVCNVMRGTLLM